MRLLLRPEVERGESLSSLLTRAAHANGLVSIRPFLQANDRRSLPRDIDLRLVGQSLAGASDSLGIKPDETAPMRLKDYVKVLNFGFAASGSHRWLLRSLRFGSPRFVVCPACLAQRPYYRLAWRLAFMTDCPVHGRSMIERCTHCDEAFHLAHFRSKAIGFCDRCGKMPLPSTQGDRHHSNRIGRHDPSGLETYARSLQLEVAYCAQVFDGVYCLISLLNRPRFAKDLARSKDAVIAGTAETVIAAGALEAFESRELAVRRQLFDASLHLLELWPDRFTRVMQDARVLAAKIKSNGVAMPYWLSSVVQEKLHEPRRRTSQAEIEAAIAHLDRAKGRYTKGSITKVLGIRESKVLDERFPAVPFDGDCLQALLRELDRTIDEAPPSRDVKATWVRDAAILTLAWASQTRVEDICAMDAKQVGRLVDQTREEIGFDRVLWDVARSYIHLYAHRVRDRFLGRNSCANFFLTRFGRGYEGNGLGQRCSAILARSGFAQPRLGLAVFQRHRREPATEVDPVLWSPSD